MNTRQSGFPKIPSEQDSEPERPLAPFRHVEVVYRPGRASPPLPQTPPPAPEGAPAAEAAIVPRQRTPAPVPHERADRAYHSIRCAVCRHPQREAIEAEFLHWRNPADIVSDYRLRHRSSLYRHAHALGLYPRRKRNLRFVLENLLERVDEVPVTALAIVRAVRAYSYISDAGEYVEPAAQVVVSSGKPVVALPAGPSPIALPDQNQSQHGKIDL